MAANDTAEAYDASNSTLQFHHAQQQPSPTDSVPATPNNVSPTSPHMPYHLPNQVRQLRPLKSPLYIPAVLRPTERNPRPSPLTPPKSLRGSLDSLEEDGNDAWIAADGRKPLDMVMGHTIIPEEEPGDVTGPPTRKHWKPDGASSSCDSPQCRSNFNLFVRKHHCRHCGHIFCSTHTAHAILLDQEARFHPDGVESRACDTCYRQFQKWDTARSMRRKNSNDSSDTNGPATPLAGPNVHRRAISQQMGQQSESVASSVPKDWAWSTF